MKRAFIFAFFLLSCTHWLIDTETRIQVENLTDIAIGELCIVSESGHEIVLVPEKNIESGKKSSIYEIELVGEFNFMVRVEGTLKPLGHYKLKGGSVLARITKENDKFEMTLK